MKYFLRGDNLNIANKTVNGMKKKIILIGGSGFIGLHLAKKLAELGFDVSIFCRDVRNIKKLHANNIGSDPEK